MKKTLLNSVAPMLLFAMLLTSCKKETETIVPSGQDTASDSFFGNNSCRLTRIWYSPDAYVGLHYNNRGLADQWVTHYSDNTEEVYNIQYDFLGRMKKAVYTYEGELQNTIRFFYTGRNLTKEIWYDANDEVYMTVNDSYNWLGQVTKRENTLGVKVLFFNDLNGNTPVIKTYIDNELSVLYNYTYNQPNKNPFKAIPGVPLGFPYMELTFSSWWETSEKATEYADGIATVLYADDPAQTVLNFGNHHTLSALFTYDYINEESNSFLFDYENCGGPQDNGGNTTYRPATIPGKRNSHELLLELNRVLRSGKNGNEIKENLSKLKAAFNK
ncbi:MAG: hypothetical protein ABI402_14290 [Ferruginibacter sp.]